MPESAGQILGKLGLDAIPFTIGAGTFFGGNFLATGSILEAAEIGVLAGLGAGFAITGVVVVGTLAIPVGIALALGKNEEAGDLANATHAVTPLLSPGVVALLPLSPFVTPEDPTLFAKALGPGLDLVSGVMTSETVDKIGAQLGALGGFQSWKSDVVSLGNYYLATQTSPSFSSGQSFSSAPTNPTSGGEPNGDGDRGEGAGFSFDFNAPGDGDTQGESPSSRDSSEIPTFTLTIELDIPGPTGTDNRGDTPQNPSATTETQSTSEDTTDSGDAGTEQTGTQSEGDGQQGGTSDGDSSGGGSEDSGGSDEGGEGPDD
jgi:hypothetical protein